MGSWGGEDLGGGGGGWWTRWFHICVQINWEKQLGEPDRPHNPEFQHGEIKPQNL